MSLPTKKMSPKKRVYGNGGIFLPWDSYEVCCVGHFYTTLLKNVEDQDEIADKEKMIYIHQVLNEDF